MPEEPDLDKPLEQVLKKMYLKPVLMVCPHLNFKGFHLQLECPVLGCDGSVVPHGWESNPAGRYVHCVEQGIYMVQYRYKCLSCSGTFTAMQLKMSHNLKLQYEIGYISSSGCMSKKLTDLIISDATTGKSFEAIAAGVGSARIGRYLALFSRYRTLCELYNRRSKDSSSLDGSSLSLNYLDFGQFDWKEGFNEWEMPSCSFVIDAFVSYISERSDQIQKIEDSRPTCSVVSFDNTFNTAQRITNVAVASNGKRVELRDKNRSFLIIMGATGVIEDMRHAADQTHHSLSCCMLKMIEKAERLISPLPTYFTTDNVKKDIGCLKKVLEKACPILKDRYVLGQTYFVFQDLIHLKNRFTETTVKACDYYIEFNTRLMKCFMGDDITVRSSLNNKAYTIKGRLPEGAYIINKISSLYAEFVKLGPDDNGKSLFSNPNTKRDGFMQTLEANRDIILNYLKDPLIKHPTTGEMVHYLETSPGNFVMLRGSTRNESLHSKLNRIWPVKCGEILANCLTIAFQTKWNFERNAGWSTDENMFGTSNSFIRLCHLDALTNLNNGKSSDTNPEVFLLGHRPIETYSRHLENLPRQPLNNGNNGTLFNSRYLYIYTIVYIVPSTSIYMYLYVSHP